MKMIHCADLHLESKLTAHLRGDKRIERRAELLESFRRMVQFGEEQKVEAILIAGDLFDTNVISETGIKTVRQLISSHPDISFYYLRGNHDNFGIFHQEDQLPDNLHLFEENWTYYLQTSKKSQIIVAGAELNDKNKDTLFQNLYLDPDGINIVMLHGQESEYQGTDRTVRIPLRELKNKGIDYLALGHIHSYREGRLDGRGVWCYPGCLEGRGFDECGEHGFILLDIDEDTGICETEFIPFASRNLYTLTVDVTGCTCTEEIGRYIDDRLEECGYERRHMMKIILSGRLSVDCEKNLTLLLKRLEQRFYYIKIYDETKLFIDWIRYKEDRSLKGEFIRLVSSDPVIGEDEKSILIRYGIQALAGEELE